MWISKVKATDGDYYLYAVVGEDQSKNPLYGPDHSLFFCRLWGLLHGRLLSVRD